MTTETLFHIYLIMLGALIGVFGVIAVWIMAADRIAEMYGYN